MIKDFLIMKREHPYGKASLFGQKFDQKYFKTARKSIILDFQNGQK